MPTEPSGDVLEQIKADAAKEQKQAADAVAPPPPKDEKPKRSRSKSKSTAGGESRGPGRPPGAKTRNRSTDAQKLAQLQPRLTELLGVMGMGLAVANPEDGRAVLENAEPLAAALTQLARENASVRRVLFMVLETSAWGAVLMALAPIVVRIGANHNVLPPALAPIAPLFGATITVPPADVPPVVPFDPTAEAKRDADAGTNGAASRVV